MLHFHVDQLADDVEEGDVRLVDRVDVNGFVTGALQVYCDGAWGAVCTSNFNDPDATVACRQLGFPTGMLLPQALSVPSSVRFTSPQVLGCTLLASQIMKKCLSERPRSIATCACPQQ